MTHVALITGITGQDGSYLAELLLSKNYIVWGTIRRTSTINTVRIDHLYKNNIDKTLFLRYADITDMSNLQNIINEIGNTYKDLVVLEVYNLAAMSHVAVSFMQPNYTSQADGIGVLNILEAIRHSNLDQSKVKFYQASTSELYGKVQEIPQTETTQFYPRSPYAIAKLYGFWITKNYREAYNMFACNGILFNHCGPKRGETFVTRKVTRGLGMILRGERDKLVMGNINSQRDWGHVKDYVRGMWMMLQAKVPNDYVIATGKTYSVRSLIEKVFSMRGFDIKWKGEGINEVGYDDKTGRELIFISEKYYRPAEVDILLGDPTKIKTELGWEPEYSFDDILKDMVDHDCA
jgi:GDPmannose 4,6-dehydratase